MRLVITIKKLLVSENKFLLKMRLRENAQTSGNGYKLEIFVFIPNLWYISQTLFARKGGFALPYFLHENESLQLCLSYNMSQMTTILVRKARF